MPPVGHNFTSAHSKSRSDFVVNLLWNSLFFSSKRLPIFCRNKEYSPIFQAVHWIIYSVHFFLPPMALNCDIHFDFIVEFRLCDYWTRIQNKHSTAQHLNRWEDFNRKWKFCIYTSFELVTEQTREWRMCGTYPMENRKRTASEYIFYCWCCRFSRSSGSCAHGQIEATRYTCVHDTRTTTMASLHCVWLHANIWHNKNIKTYPHVLWHLVQYTLKTALGKLFCSL